MFCIKNKTVRHSPLKMMKTFAKLRQYMQKEKMNEEVKGRKMKYKIPDAMKRGQHIVQTTE